MFLVEHVVPMKTVSIGTCGNYKDCFYWTKQSTSINYLPTYYTRIMIIGV